jgi:hypothetical protein
MEQGIRDSITLLKRLAYNEAIKQLDLEPADLQLSRGKIMAYNTAIRELEQLWATYAEEFEREFKQ